MTIRFFILSSHYRSPTDFSEEALEAAGRGLERLLGAVGLVRERLRDAQEGEPDAGWSAKLEETRARVAEVMDDDFGTPQAIAALFDLGRDVNGLLYSGEPVSHGTLEAIDALYREIGGDVLGIVPDDMARQAGGDLVDTLLRLLIDLRQQARQNRNWAEADAIRDRLAEMGVTLEDSAEGTRWRLAR